MEKKYSLIEAEEVADKQDSGLGNLDIGSIAGLLKNVDINQILGLLNSVDISQLSSLFGSTFGSASTNSGGTSKGNREVEVLNAIKPMVSAQRGELIDVILQIYAISRILK